MKIVKIPIPECPTSVERREGNKLLNKRVLFPQEWVKSSIPQTSRILYRAKIGPVPVRIWTGQYYLAVFDLHKTRSLFCNRIHSKP